MSTPNFYVKNASKHYTISGRDIDDWNLREIELSESLENEFGDNYCPESNWDNQRSYPGRTVGSITKYLSGKFSDFGITINAIIRSGYYTGATLDWEIHYIGHDSFELETTSWYDGYKEMKEDIAWLFEGDYNPGLVAIFTQRVYDRLTELSENLVERVEKIFESNSQTYRRVAIASNGEAFYEKI